MSLNGEQMCLSFRVKVGFLFGRGNLSSCGPRKMWEKTLLRCTKFFLTQVVCYTVPGMNIIFIRQAHNNLWPEEGATTQLIIYLPSINQQSMNLLENELMLV